MNVYLPIADLSINLLLVVGIGALVGLLCGVFGVGGGFLLTPFMMIVGIPPAVAVASDSNQIVAGATSGSFAHWRLGNVDVKLGLLILAGGATGGGVGVEAVKILRDVGSFQFAMKLLYVLVLGLLGGVMFVESFRTIMRNRKRCELPFSPQPPLNEKRQSPGLLPRLPLHMSFPKSQLEVSALLPFALGVLVGFASAMLGVGGGFILVPAMIYVLRMPTVMAVGTSLFQIVLTSGIVTFLQASTNQTVDVVLATCLLIGSTLGAQVGVRLSRRARGEQIRILLSLLVLGMMVNLLLDLTLEPPDRLGLVSSAGTKSAVAVTGSRRATTTRSGTSQRAAGSPGTVTSAATQSSALPDAVITDELTAEVDIGLSYGGERMELFGTLGYTGADAVIVRVSGPLETIKLNETGRWGPFWATTRQHVVEGVPVMHQVDASDKIDKILSPDLRRKLGIGFDSIRAGMSVRTTRGRSNPDDREDVLNGVFRIKEAQGLYQINDGNGAFDIKRGRLFKHRVNFPPTVKEGEYRAETFAFKEGQLVGTTTDIIHVRKVGLEAKIVRWACDYPKFYGACAVMLALGAGLLVGFVFRAQRPH